MRDIPQADFEQGKRNGEIPQVPQVFFRDWVLNRHRGSEMLAPTVLLSQRRQGGDALASDDKSQRGRRRQSWIGKFEVAMPDRLRNSIGPIERESRFGFVRMCVATAKAKDANDLVTPSNPSVSGTGEEKLEARTLQIAPTGSRTPRCVR